MLSLAPHPLQSIWADLFICTIPPKICTQIDSQGFFLGYCRDELNVDVDPKELDYRAYL
jgi:hypothetical protein